MNDWARADGGKLMIAARRNFNDPVRQLLRSGGELGSDAIEIAGQGLTSATR